MKKIASVIPGFRTGHLWKKIVAIVGYFVLIIVIVALIFGSGDSSVSSKDNLISTWESIALIIFLLVIPFILITNVGNIRSKLPLFKSPSLGKKITAWILSSVIVFIVMILTSAILGNSHSPEYKALQQQRSEEQAIQAAQEKAKKEADRKVELAKEAEEKAKEEAEKQAKLTKEAEEKAAQASEEKAKNDAEEQAKLAKAAEEEAQKEADNQAKLAEQAVTTSSTEDNKQTTATSSKSFSSWLGGLFHKSGSPNDSQKNLKNIDSYLKKGDTKKLLEVYNTSDDQIKKYIEDGINNKYLETLRDNKDIFLNKKASKIQKLYDELAFIAEIPNLKNSDVGLVLAETKKYLEANTALSSFKKEHPNLQYGVIKDISDVQSIDCYVNYRLKDSGTKIGNLTIESNNYSNSYYITSYTYSEFLGYTPSDDWEAILLLSDGSTLSQSGTYKTDVVPFGSTRLIDSKGFEKDYPQYREVTQKDYDKYYKVNDLMQKQNELDNTIEESISHISERLA